MDEHDNVQQNSAHAATAPTQDLIVGGLYSVKVNNPVFGVVKVLAVNGDTVHLYLYRNSFTKRPRSPAKIKTLLAAEEPEQPPTNAHIMISRRIFSVMRPVYLETQAATDAEFKFYRRWMLMHDYEPMTDFNPEQRSNRQIFYRIFAGSALSYAFAVGLYLGITRGWLLGLSLGLLAGIIFGLCMTTLQWLGVRKLIGEGESADAMQLKELSLELSFSEAVTLGRRALNAVHGLKELSIDQKTGTLEGYTGLSWKSLGEKITLSFYPISQTSTGVFIFSEPSLDGSLDYGKNLENVRKIGAILRNE